MPEGLQARPEIARRARSGERAGLTDRWRRLRLSLVMSPRFQRFAARFPITRRHARHRADDLFRLTAGFVYSQILQAAVECDLFRRLADRPMTLAEISSATGLQPDRAERLIEGCQALDLVFADGRRRFWPSDLGAVLAANDGIAAMIRHHAMLYRDLDRPLELLHGRKGETETARFWSYAGSHGADDSNAAAYSQLMSASQDLVAGEILDAYRLSPGTRILDIGGGDGAFLRAVAQRRSDVALWLFDLPAVVTLAQTRFQEAGLSERAHVHGGDFFRDDLPGDADIVTLVRILCDHDDSGAIALLKNIHRAMKPGAALLIGEPMAGRGGSEALVSAYFGFYFLAMGQGRCRTPEGIFSLLSAAGFTKFHRQTTRSPLFSSLVVAIR